MRLDPAAVEQVAGDHDSAAQLVDHLARTAPSNVDAGEAQESVLSILASLSSTSADLVLVNRLLAVQVRATAQDVAGTDGGTGATLGLMAGTFGVQR